MSKYTTLATIKIDKDRIGPDNVIELDDDVGAPLVKGGFLAPANSDAAVTAPKEAAKAYAAAVAAAQKATQKAKAS